MPGPPHDPGVDPDDDNQDIPDAEDDHDEDEASATERHAPTHGAPMPPFARHGRPETRYRMELANQLYVLILRASGMLITETYILMIGCYGCGEACHVTCTT